MKTQESVISLLRAISHFTYEFNFKKSLKLLTELDQSKASSEQVNFLKSLHSLFSEMEKISIPETGSTELKNTFDTNWKRELEEEQEKLYTIFTPICQSGLKISDFKKTLFYFSSLSLAKTETQKELLENWTFPYVESLLTFFSLFENHEELMEAHREHIKIK